MACIDNWSLFGGYFVLLNQQSTFEVLYLFEGWSLLRSGL